MRIIDVVRQRDSIELEQDMHPSAEMLSQDKSIQRKSTFGNNEEINEEEVKENLVAQTAEFKETGIFAQFVKGFVLTGSAFNGFDTNNDFKVKTDFKSVTLFKNLRTGRTYFFTRLFEVLFRQLESRTNTFISSNLLYIHFHYAFESNIYLSINKLARLSKESKSNLISTVSFSITKLYLLETFLEEFRKNQKDQIDYGQFI